MTKKDDHKDQEVDELAEKLKKAQQQAAENDAQEETQTSELDQVKQELATMTEMAKRAMADLQNLKRRQEEERFAMIAQSNAKLIEKLLPALENLNRAINHIPEEANSSEPITEWIKGLVLSIDQFKKVFEDMGLKVVESVGQPFNPDLHEAMAQGPGEKDTILEEFEKGYMLGSRVIRHAKVKVGNGE